MHCNKMYISALKRIVFGFFPHLNAALANKKIITRKDIIQTDKRSYIIEKAPEEKLLEFTKEEYNRTIYQKDKLEDKAKTNVIGITIAITLIIGSSGILDTIGKKYTNIIFPIIASALVFIAILYLIVAGLSVIKVLCDGNVISFPDDTIVTKKDAAQISEYEKSISYNKMNNMIRNNNINASYMGIRNALICMLIIVIIVVFPVNAFSNDKNSAESLSGKGNYMISYSQNVVNTIMDTDVFDSVQRSIREHYNQIISTEETQVSFLDDSETLFIKCYISNNTVLVEEIETITALE